MHVDFGMVNEKEFEEGEPHQVIPVSVGQQKMDLVTTLLQQGVSQPADPGAGIDDNDVAAAGADFDTGGITPVFEILFA